MTAENIFYVYVLFRPWDGSPFYVGKGSGRRWLVDKSRAQYNSHFARILKKSEEQGLDIPRIKIRERLSNDEAFAIEIAFIKAIGRSIDGGPLVNMTDGGDGASRLDEVARKKIGLSKLGKLRSKETCAKISAAAKIRPNMNIGRTHTENTRINMSLAHKGKPSPNRGIIISAEIREKIRASKLGQTPSLATRMKRSASMKRAWIIRREIQHPR